jgi:hypothetical protein
MHSSEIAVVPIRISPDSCPNFMFLRRSTLSTGGLCIAFKDELGRLSDVESIFWTVSSSHSGKRVSGIRMRAIRNGVGRYYAPWYADDPTGAYEILWEYRVDASSPLEKTLERFFVTDIDDSLDKNGHAKNLPPPGGHVFETGSFTGDFGLVLCLINFDGIKQDGYNVVWRIECLSGNPVTDWKPAKRTSVGEYSTNWTVNVCGGQYFIRWRWSEFNGAPLEEAMDTFQVVNQVDMKQGLRPVGWKTVF